MQVSAEKKFERVHPTEGRCRNGSWIWGQEEELKIISVCFSVLYKMYSFCDVTKIMKNKRV